MLIGDFNSCELEEGRFSVRNQTFTEGDTGKTALSDQRDSSKRIPSWMSKHPVLGTMLKQISDHEYTDKPFCRSCLLQADP